jgi:hypothetical protein
MYHVHPHLAQLYVKDRLDEMREAASDARKRRQGPRRQRHRQRR